jgi:hypothetical protein
MLSLAACGSQLARATLRGEESSMAQKILRLYLESIMVNSNGVPPGWEDGKPHNLVVATLRYPRSGAPSIVSTKHIRLQNQIEFDPNASPSGSIWERLIFKEQVDDETELQVKVLYHHDPSKLDAVLKALCGLASGIVETALLTTGVLGIVIGGMVGELADVAKQSGPETLFLGQTDPLMITVAGVFSDPVALGVTNPKDKHIPYFPPGSSAPQFFTIPANNGVIRLRPEWEPP